MTSFDPESSELITEAFLSAEGLGRDELVLGGIGMMRKSILDMLDTLMTAGLEDIPLPVLRQLIAESELELLQVSHDEYLKGIGGGNG